MWRQSDLQQGLSLTEGHKHVSGAELCRSPETYMQNSPLGKRFDYFRNRHWCLFGNSIWQASVRHWLCQRLWRLRVAHLKEITVGGADVCLYICPGLKETKVCLTFPQKQSVWVQWKCLFRGGPRNHGQRSGPRRQRRERHQCRYISEWAHPLSEHLSWVPQEPQGDWLEATVVSLTEGETAGIYSSAPVLYSLRTTSRDVNVQACRLISPPHPCRPVIPLAREWPQIGTGRCLQKVVGL